MVPGPRSWKRGSTSAAFTLVELLVVIAIIAGLAAFLLPALGITTTKAKQTNCQNRAKQIATAIESYRVENESRYPFCTITDWSDANRPTNLSTAPYPPYAYDPYWGASLGGFPFLWAALLNFDIAAPHPASGAMPSAWRCPARQTQKSSFAGGDPWMVLNNRNWQTSYTWNYPNAFSWQGTNAISRSAPERGYARARLVFDYTLPGWAKRDVMHLDGTINVIYADLHAARESFDVWTTLNPNTTSASAGQRANAWWVDGWVQ